MKGTHRFAALLILILGLMAGCAEGPDDEARSLATSPGELAQGLTVLEATDTTISAAYKRDDVVIYLEAARGALAPDMYQQETPHITRYEVDTRLMADNGRLFFVQRGGDHWIDPTWLDDLERENEQPGTSVSNEALFEMAGAVHPILIEEVRRQVGAARAEALEPALRALIEVSQQATEAYASMVAHREQHGDAYGLSEITAVPYGAPLGELQLADPANAPQETDPTTEQEVAYGSDDMGGDDVADRAADAGYYYIAVYDKSTAVIGRHSATRLYKWNGAWATVADSCNHGGCPTGSTAGEASASYKCSLSYTVAVVDYKPAWDLMTCNATGYAAFSGDGHNCHDDTRLQMANFVYGNGSNKNPGSQFWCSTDDDSDISSWPGDQSGSPECDDSKEDGFRHNDMCQFQGTTGYNAAGSCYCDAACTNFGDCCLDGPR